MSKIANKKFPEKFSRLKTRLDRWSVPARIGFVVVGLASTVWFLVRVIPKPSRAAYPCMRTAAPLMSAFIVYVLSFSGAYLALKRARAHFLKKRYALTGIFAGLSLVISMIFFGQDVRVALARTVAVQGVLPDLPNTPMGVGQGINPGRVVWTYNPAATNANCKNDWGPDGKGNTADDDGYFLPKNTDKEVVRTMMDSALINLTGEASVHDAWDKLFTHFNSKKGLGEVGYTTGQTIFIKINQGSASWLADLTTMNPSSLSWAKGNYGNSETTPQSVLAVIHQLVTEYGVPQEMIYVGDPIAHVYQYLVDVIKAEYPNVIFFDHNLSTKGRTVTSGLTSSSVIYYSDEGKEMPDANSDRMYQEMYDANYLINIAALKAHARAGVTFCAKNHFGSHGRDGASHLHPGLIAPENDIQQRTDYHMYRVLVDLIGHEKLGGNTLLFIVDGLWGGPEAVDKPVKWKMAPFNNNWPNSLFVSQDEVALESVCLDFLRQEASLNTAFKNRPFFGGVDDYLHQAADQKNWPANMVYDPEGDGTPIPSLGVHEHWNNPTNKQYSRNLNTGEGIDLVSSPRDLVIHSTTGMSTTIAGGRLRVYPNPATDHIQLRADFPGENSVKLLLTDPTGSQVLSQSINEPNGSFSKYLAIPAGLNKGTYFLTLVGKQHRETVKIVIQ